MLHNLQDALDRLRAYAARRGRALDEQLGYGQDGVVYSSNLRTAMKAFRYPKQFAQEREVYQRLAEHHVTVVAGFSVPQLLNYDDDLQVIEMTIVSPPFVLDFAAGYVDRLPPYPPEDIEEWEREKREEFGDCWDDVLAILSGFRRYGVRLSDIHRNNIKFANET